LDSDSQHWKKELKRDKDLSFFSDFCSFVDGFSSAVSIRQVLVVLLKGFSVGQVRGLMP
jgi:hypothetical protein